MDDAGGGLRGLRARPAKRLIEAVHNAYGIASDAPPADLGGSSNLNLLVCDGEDRWVVRVYRPYVTPERLRDVHVVRHELDAAGVPCEGLILTRRGDEWMVFRDRLVEVEGFVDRDADMDSWAALEAGMPVLARTHDCLRGLPLSEAGKHPLFANYVGSADALAATLDGTERIRSWGPTQAELALVADAERLAHLVSNAETGLTAELPTQLVHGDFWDNNVFLRGGNVVYVTDFDFMGQRPRIDDLALTMFFACMEYFEDPVSDAQLRRVRALLDAYEASCQLSLSPHERAALPSAIARQPLWSIGGWVRLLDDDSAARQHAAGSHREVGWALHLMEDLERWQAACA